MFTYPCDVGYEKSFETVSVGIALCGIGMMESCMNCCLFDQTCTLDELSRITGTESVSNVVDVIFLIFFDV